MGKPLRISLVTETYFPQINGVSRTLDRLVRHCAGSGDQVQLLLPRYPQPPAELSAGIDRHDWWAMPLPFYREVLFYEPAKAISEHLGKGLFGLATKDADGNWINAVNKNFGGTPKFVMGPWKEGYALGTYGVDPGSKTAWAVINYNGNFAVARFMN